jgi:hypothetical protein
MKWINFTWKLKQCLYENLVSLFQNNNHPNLPNVFWFWLLLNYATIHMIDQNICASIDGWNRSTASNWPSLLLHKITSATVSLILWTGIYVIDACVTKGLIAAQPNPSAFFPRSSDEIRTLPTNRKWWFSYNWALCWALCWYTIFSLLWNLKYMSIRSAISRPCTK